VIAAALLVAALAARPDWVDGMPAKFPRERFLVAVGSADERPTAEARARAGIAAFFESRVSSVTRATETEGHATASRTDRVEGVAVTAATELRAATISASQEVASATAKLLEGVEIADAWTDPEGRIHALAVLDRARAVETLARRLAEVDAEVAALAARLAEEKAPLARARVAHRIVRVAARRRPLLDDLRILEPAAEPAPPPGAAGARAAADRALAAVAVAVRTSGDEADRLRAAAIRGVLATGMRVAAAGGPSDLSVSIEAEASAPSVSDGWTVARLTARARILDARKEPTGSFVETAKGTSGRPDEASRRAGEALAVRLEERLAEELRTRLDAE
jgi:hypothetical protein